LASYQETNFRKRKHSLGIIQRNSFLKQVSEDRPDEVSGEEGGVDVPFDERVYYRPEQVDSYDPGLQWRKGEDGKFFYDGREGTRTLDEALYRAFVSKYESDMVEDAYRAMLLSDGAFSRIGTEAEASSHRTGPAPHLMARIYQEALEVSSSQLRREGVEGSGAGILLRSMAGRAMHMRRGLSDIQWIGRWSDLAHSIRRDATQEMVERGLYTTESVRDMVAGVPAIDEEDQLHQDDEFDIGRPSVAAVTAPLERASVWSGREWEEDEGEPNLTAGEENLEPTFVGEGTVLLYNDNDGYYYEYTSEGTPTGPQYSFEETLGTSLTIVGEPSNLAEERETTFFEDETPSDMSQLLPGQEPSLGTRSAMQIKEISPEVYERLSAWGKDSLASPNLILGNSRLWEQTPIVFLVDAGDLIVPQSHREGYKTIDNKKAGTPIRTSRRKSDGTIDWRQGISRGMYTEAFNNIKYHNKMVSDGQTAGPPLKEPQVLSFGEWMEERDKTFQDQLAEAEKKQSANYKERQSYYPERIAEFDNRGIGVVGEIDENWAIQHGGEITARYEEIENFLRRVTIPDDILILPPESIEQIDNPEAYRSVGSGYDPNRGFQTSVNFQTILQDWFHIKLDALKPKNPISWDNQGHWDFGHSVTTRAARTVSSINSSGRVASDWGDDIDDESTIISVAGNGEVGAALFYTGRELEHWHVDTAGTNAKNFPIYPFKEIHNALSSAVDKETDLDRKKELRNLLRGWRENGRRLPSGTAHGVSDTKHAMYVFAEFSRQVVLDDNVEFIDTSPLSDYVSNMYKRMGFAEGDGFKAHRLNILWNLAYLWPDMMPRDVSGSIITKSIIDNSDKYGIITTDNSLSMIQNMLDGLMKESKRSHVTDEERAAEDYKESEIHRKELSMTRAEYSEFLLEFTYMLSGTGQPEEGEDKS